MFVIENYLPDSNEAFNAYNETVKDSLKWDNRAKNKESDRK